MALESGTYISDLNANNPTGSDSKNQGDDHFRLIKSTIKNTFPNITGAVNTTQAELNKLDGLTATTAELNKLDGLSASTADLDAVAGVITTQGDLMVGDASGDESRLAVGASDTVLRSNGTGPTWGKVQTADLSNNAVTATKIGSGEVGQSELASGAVGQGELKTTQGTISHNGGSGVTAKLTVPGGQYGFYPEIRQTITGGTGYVGWMLGRADGSGTAPTTMVTHSFTSGTSFIAQATLYADAAPAETATAYLRQRYVQASPPYNLGNGDIPIFIFVHVRPDGSIGGSYIAEDPPWAHNGPTRVTADRVDKDGRKYQRREVSAVTLQDVEEGRADIADLFAAAREASEEWVEITQQIKQADMPLIPHPWIDDPSEGRIVLLDPLSEHTHRLRELNRKGEDVAKIIHDGYLTITNEDSGAIAPPRTQAVRYRPRTSRA